jgi:hypothetical protein
MDAEGETAVVEEDVGTVAAAESEQLFEPVH